MFPEGDAEHSPGLARAARPTLGLRMNTLSFSFPRRFGTAAGFASGCPKTNSAPMVSRTQGRPRCAGQPWAVLWIPFGELSGAKSARWDPPSEFKLCGLGRRGPGERRRWGERASLRVAARIHRHALNSWAIGHQQAFLGGIQARSVQVFRTGLPSTQYSRFQLHLNKTTRLSLELY